MEADWPCSDLSERETEPSLSTQQRFGHPRYSFSLFAGHLRSAVPRGGDGIIQLNPKAWMGSGMGGPQEAPRLWSSNPIGSCLDLRFRL